MNLAIIPIKFQISMRQSYNLLFEKFLLVNYTRSIRMSDEFRVMNSLDDLIHVRIDHCKLFAGHVLVDTTRLTMTSEKGRKEAGSFYPKRACIRPNSCLPKV